MDEGINSFIMHHIHQESEDSTKRRPLVRAEVRDGQPLHDPIMEVGEAGSRLGRISRVQVPRSEPVRVSTLELFFDLVFVFTITQLTTVLVEHPNAKGVLQVVLMLGVIWWMYGGYAWLTNAVPPDQK